MKVAVVGSRGIVVSRLQDYLPQDTTQIISGGAIGVDRCARAFALENNIEYKEFLPQYSLYGKCAPLKRNLQIIECADLVIAFWDGKSRGTSFVISNCKKMNVKIKVFSITK